MTSSYPIETIASVATSSPVESLYQVIIIGNTGSGISNQHGGVVLMLQHIQIYK